MLNYSDSSNTVPEYVKMVNKRVIKETHALYDTLIRQVILILLEQQCIFKTFDFWSEETQLHPD